VIALAKDSRHGTADQARTETQTLARLLGVESRIAIVTSLLPDHFAAADIVTNSGHLRPISSRAVAYLKPSAVLPSMYEAWEFRSGDVDLAACRRHGIRVAGTNERPPDVGVFEFLGPLVVKAALSAGHDLLDEHCLVISDNDFAPFLERALK